MPAQTRRIKEVYIGAFEIPGDESAESIFNGMHQLDNGSMQVRGTIEHELNAVPSLIVFCDFIADKLGLKWRLLKFEEPEEIDEKTIDEYRQLCQYAGQLQ